MSESTSVIKAPARPGRRSAWSLSLLLLITLLPTMLLASEPAIRTIMVDTAQVRQAGLQAITDWRYRPGDSAGWASPDYVDSGWALAESTRRVDLLPSGWTGIGWFRAHFSLDSSLMYEPLAILMEQVGASEVYIDGRLVRSYGKLGTSPNEEEHLVTLEPEVTAISLSPQQRYLIAVRFSTHESGRLRPDQDLRGFSVYFGPINRLIELYGTTWEKLLSKQMFLTGVALSMALLHLLMFVFYRDIRGNLHIGMLCLCFAGLAFLPAKAHFVTTLWHLNLFLILVKLCLVVGSLLGPWVLYGLFQSHPPRYFRWLVGTGVLIVLANFWLPIYVFMAFAVLVMIEASRVILSGLRQKVTMAWVVGLGYLAFIMSALYEIVPSLVHVGYRPIADTYLWGIFAFTVSLSVYLARSFGRTNLNLRLRLKEVESLSAVTVEQERKAQEQETKRRLLEADLAHQAQQLEKARELEKALEDLAKTHRHLQDTQSQLAQSEKMASLGQLVAGVAHEINTPVGAAASMHETLMLALNKIKARFNEIDDSSEEMARCFKIVDDADRVIRTGNERVTNIVRRLRSFARLDEAELQKVDIHEGLEDTLTLIHHDIKHGITVHRQYGKLPRIACYPGQLNQVFLNILVNARQAMGGKGEIFITTSYKNDRIHIQIRDTGPGIPEEHLSQVFDPGFTTKGVGVGTGLGLSICYQIIKGHFGDISVESQEGKGTTFSIWLPIDLDKRVDGA